MRRREFVKLMSGIAAVWPLAAQAQQNTGPLIGFLSSRSPGESAAVVAGFHKGLAQAGYVERQNIAIDYLWAENHYDRLPTLAAELVKHQVKVIAAVGGVVTGLAVKATTKTIPFVFISGEDPVKLGLVDSFARPGGDATGINLLITAVEAKRLALLHELVPSVRRIAIAVNPNSPDAGKQESDVETACRTLGLEPQILRIGTDAEIDGAFEHAVRSEARALLVAADPLFNSNRARIVALAERHKLPGIYESREYVTAGGLMSYGPDIADMYRQIGLYTGQILKGIKPADLPVFQPTALALVINLKTAKALDLEIPPTLLARADEVIE